ncbi:MAG: RdgB/HAM1 family non-canonical purine NTP pyrophosphatase [Alphaproteobacteria bacterium]|nr:RdgB/HAM1 family non-canonical purine NTP pyrophosphatase [Alphaproteobacteria bacterium]
MNVKELIFASRNAGKIAEIKDMLSPLGIEVKSALDLDLPDVEENGATFAENSLLKSQTIAHYTGLPCIADDSGLCVEALGGGPGVYTARYAPNRDFDKGMDKLLTEMKNSPIKSRKAWFCCVLSLAFPNGRYELFEGRVDGTIAEKKSGTTGFGFDPLFIPDGYTCSFAQMNKEEKNAISHRGRAMKKFQNFLQHLKGADELEQSF